MSIGNPISLTSQVASKTISIIATASQTAFTVTGGYRINQLAVFRNGIRLVDSRDYEARDGATVTLLSAASDGDAVEFQVFDAFQVADTINPYSTYQTIDGNLNITGIITAATFSVTDLDVRNITGVAATFTGQVTYEDVTNVDSIGLSTFRAGINVTGGSVGIGTDNPARKLEIFDTAATVLQLNSTNTDGTSLRIQNSGTDKMYMGLAGDFITGQGSNVTDSAIRASGSLLFASGGATERLRILSGGQVNIGGNYTQTTYTMQVTGTINATSNITQNGNALATNGKAIAMALIFG
jgi:hypothetical protein